MPTGHFSKHNLYDPPPRQFDFVLCTEVLEHLENPELAYQHLQQAVRPGGSLLIAVPNGRFDRSGYHINFWSPESWSIFIERGCELSHWSVGTFTDNVERPESNNYAFLRF